jgi:hypothetical protein
VPVAPASGGERVIPDNKITAEDKIAPAARIGETSPEKERVAKPGDPDLRRRICEGSACKEPAPKPEPPESDLRHRICPGGVCRCPAGETAGKTGCTPAAQNQQAFQCPAGSWWNGGACIASPRECASFTGRAELLLNELRSLDAEVRNACSNDPSSTECRDAKIRRDEALQRYRMLQNEASQECRGLLPEPPL